MLFQSPQGTSPSTLSPTSRPQGRFSFGGSPPNESPGPPLYSPLSPHSPPTVASTPVSSVFYNVLYIIMCWLACCKFVFVVEVGWSCLNWSLHVHTDLCRACVSIKLWWSLFESLVCHISLYSQLVNYEHTFALCIPHVFVEYKFN